MLMVGSSLLEIPVLSLHVGGQIARVKRAIIDPESLTIIAFELDGALLRDPEIGSFLMAEDIRETSAQGIVVDTADRFVEPTDVIRLQKILDLNFDLVGLKVVAKEGKGTKKIGKVVDYTVDDTTLSIFQLIAQRPFMSSFIDPQLTINRSQITEIDDYKVTIMHEKQKVKLPSKKQQAVEEFVPNYTNPFRKADYSSVDELEESSSMTSE